MCRLKSLMVLVMVALFLGISGKAFAAYDSSDNDASIRKNGMAWNMADDRKMENIAGVQEPEGLDKYMKRYFDQLVSKVETLSSKIDKLNEQVVQMQTLLAKKDSEKASSQGRIL